MTESTAEAKPIKPAANERQTNLRIRDQFKNYFSALEPLDPGAKVITREWKAQNKVRGSTARKEVFNPHDNSFAFRTYYFYPDGKEAFTDYVVSLPDHPDDFVVARTDNPADKNAQKAEFMYMKKKQEEPGHAVIQVDEFKHLKNYIPEEEFNKLKQTVGITEDLLK